MQSATSRYERASGRVTSIGRRQHRAETDTSAVPRPIAASTVPMGDLIAQLQKICQRQQFRADERIFLRDIDKIVSQVQIRDDRVLAFSSQEGVTFGASESTEESTDGETGAIDIEHSDNTAQAPVLSDADLKVEALLDVMEALFRHRHEEVRKLAFEILNLSLTHYGGQLTHSMRARVFQQLEDHDSGGDFEVRQKLLRVLTNDGRLVEPFSEELGWLLLQWLEDSDQQRDLLSLIQNILRRSPQALDFETVIAITSVVCGRCDIAWSRGDVETCRRFLSFFHVLVTHRLEHALGTSVCLRTLCWMVNADGQGTWSVMKHLLSSTAGFQVLRGLVSLLENPWQHNQWVLRGAVFFVGMSCWGSQRVTKLEQIKWTPILLALESSLQCENGVVIFEIILAIQRLIKKYGDAKTQSGKPISTSTNSQPRHLVVEWTIILRMLQTLRPWLSPDDNTMTSHVGDDDQARTRTRGRSSSTDVTAVVASPSSSQASTSTSVPVHLTRIPKELLDTIQVVVDLVREKKFAGEVDEFYDLLQAYFIHLPESTVQLLLRYRAETSHPAHSIDWLHSLEETMETFFANRSLPSRIREEALQLLRVNLWSSRNVCEDRVIEEVLLPILSEIYDDPDAGIRRKSLDLITEVARTHESVRFESLLDILESAVLLSAFEDTQQCAMAGIVSLFSSWFDHLPHSRPLRMYDIITTVAESHRQWRVRRTALECLLHVCTASSDYRLQWHSDQVRTSRFLYCSRRAVRNQLTGAFVPVAHGLRALITLVSTESHAVLFRMVVEGLRRMLNNRVILAEIDISDAAIKIVSCVDYQAFGRAAIPDEISTYLEDLEAGLSQRDSQGRETNDGPKRPSLSSRVASSLRINYQTVKSSNQDAAALLCKTRFVTMGLEILALFVSFIGDLNATARHHLMICIVGALDTQPVLCETDLSSRHGTESDGSIHGESGWSWTVRPRTGSAGRGVSTPDDGVQATAQVSELCTPTFTEAKPVSSHVAFTSRVFSKLQATTHSSHLFSALSTAPAIRRSTSNSSTASTETTVGLSRLDREMLRNCLRHIFEAEFEQLRIACNAISMLANIVPEVVSARMDMMMHSLKRSFYTPEGVFRGDKFASVLEMAGDLVMCTPATLLKFHHKSVVVTDLVLVAFKCAVAKPTLHLAYRILCEIIFRSKRREDRGALARAALPGLKSSVDSAKSQLADAAVDFLMSFALSNSDLIPAPALTTKSGDERDTTELRSSTRSWIHHDAVISVELHNNKQAVMIIRRANSTSRWCLAMKQDVAAVDDSSAVRAKIQLDTEADTSTPHAVVSEVACETVEVTAKFVVDPAPPSNLPVARPRPTVSQNMWRAETTPTRQPTPNLVEFSTNAPHNIPVPPLPAYDGVGGSPSFFCVPPPEDGGDPLKMMESMLLSDITIDTPENQSPSDSRPPEVECCHDAVAEEKADDPPGDQMEGTPPSLQHAHDVAEAVASCPEASDPEEASLTPPRLDPMFLMAQVFDLGAEDRPQELSSCDALSLGLSVLDRTPEFETHKIGVLYLRHPRQKTEADILGNIGGSVRYLEFLRALGSITCLEGLHGYSGGMDTSPAQNDGKCLLLYRSHALQMVFHVATMMTPLDEVAGTLQSSDTIASTSSTTASVMKKKRHIGNDFVHIIFKECDAEYDVHTFSGQFNAVHIIVQPLNGKEYRVQVKCKPGIPSFGPLSGTQVVPRSVVAQCVRQTSLNANLACQAFHQDLIGLTMNCEERLKQIRQLAARHVTTVEDWAVEDLTHS